jgi:hypothetical protein
VGRHAAAAAADRIPQPRRSPLRDLAATYCCDLAATNGQVGGFLHTEVAPLLAEVPGRPVGYLGDLDLAAGQIEANSRRVLERYDPGLAERWERLALTEAQVDRLVAEHYGGDRDRLVIVKLDGRHQRWGWTCCPPGHASVETEALSQQVIVGLVRAWLDALLPQPLADVLVRQRAQRAAVAAALARLDGDGDRR